MTPIPSQPALVREIEALADRALRSGLKLEVAWETYRRKQRAKVERELAAMERSDA